MKDGIMVTGKQLKRIEWNRKEGAEEVERIAKDLAYHYKKRSSKEEGEEEEQPNPGQG